MHVSHCTDKTENSNEQLLILNNKNALIVIYISNVRLWLVRVPSKPCHFIDFPYEEEFNKPQSSPFVSAFVLSNKKIDTFKSTIIMMSLKLHGFAKEKGYFVAV